MAKEIISWVIGICALLVIWHLFAWKLHSADLPSPIAVIDSIYRNRIIHWDNLLQTGKEAMAGLLLSMFISAILIILIGSFPRIENIIYPFIILLKSTPAVAFVPIFIILVGTGVLTKIFISALICFFPMIIGGIDGMKRTPKKYYILSHTYGGCNSRRFFNVEIGYAINGLCSGLKTAAPLSVVGAIVGEYVTGGNQSGLGAFIITNSVKSIKINLYAGALLATFLGLIFFFLSNVIAAYYEKKLYIRD